MGTNEEATLEWFNDEEGTIQTEGLGAWRISEEEGEFGGPARTGICISLGSEANKSVVLTDAQLAALGYVPA